MNIDPSYQDSAHQLFIPIITEHYNIPKKKKHRSTETMPGVGGPSGPEGGRLPMLRLPHKTRYNLLCVIGEFVGTFMFLFFSFAGTQVAFTPKPPDGAPPNTDSLLYSSLAFGFSLVVNVWAFFRVTGGLFNPAVRDGKPNQVDISI